MQGKKREKKLVIKEGKKIERGEIVKVLEQYASNTKVQFQVNSFYRDTYFDDEFKSLFKEGGSLKIRTGCGGMMVSKQKVVMRRKTSNTMKMKYTLWDEVELPMYGSSGDLQLMLSPLKPFFRDFDFDSIVPEPILVCSTSRSEYSVSIDGSVIMMYVDCISYESDKKTASDELIKFRSRSEEINTDHIFEYLLKHFPEYEMINTSRYERALFKLN